MKFNWIDKIAFLILMVIAFAFGLGTGYLLMQLISAISKALGIT